MKISEIITDKYKWRIPPTVYYELLADVQEVEEEQEHILDKIRAEINTMPCAVTSMKEIYVNRDKVINIIDKNKAESEE